MAPIPEDNRDNNTPPNKDSDEISDFSNPNLVSTLELTDSSDNSEDEDDSAAPSGYSLLPQDPNEAGNAESDEDSEYEQDNRASAPAECSNDVDEVVPEAVITSEAGAAAPTVSLSNVSDENHPAFLAKFPDGKLPSYMQVPSVPRDKTDQLWNLKRQEENKISIDSAQESKILKAMAGFSLPASNIPDWAQSLSDEKWRQHIQDRIQTGQKSIPSGKDISVSPQQRKKDKSSDQDLNPEAPADKWVADFPEPADGEK